MGEFFLLQILTLNLLLSNIAVDSTIGDFCICIIFVPLVFLSVKSQKGRGAQGGGQGHGSYGRKVPSV